ncbi:hypothetical protein [Cytobacillus sp. IB215316]|nr:hypothetical protein [Cytobacillus sp. IB215316]MDX8360923.1 hypothetical protein [Cytobacillus sp. IB215316]
MNCVLLFRTWSLIILDNIDHHFINYTHLFRQLVITSFYVHMLLLGI